MAGHDWLEGASVLLGLAFLALGLASAWGFVVALTSLGDPEPAFEGSRGVLESTRGFGVVLFGVLALVAGAVGWFFAGEALRRGVRRVRGRG